MCIRDRRTVTVALGNNGRIGVEIPGALSVTKTAEVADGFDGPKDTIDEAVFSFEVSFTDAVSRCITGNLKLIRIVRP